MITVNNMKESHELYKKLIDERPDLFKSNSSVEYITNMGEIIEYEQVTGERIGVLYKMGKHEVFVVDLLKKDGGFTVHGRIILPNNGVIIVPKIGDKFVLEDQYRYPVCDKHLAFPRGHCEFDADAGRDAVREIEEELMGAKLTNLSYLGKTYPETHSDAWFCSVYEGDIEGLSIENGELRCDGYEGIENLVLLSADEIEAKIRNGEIDCGYTLAAWALYKASQF